MKTERDKRSISFFSRGYFLENEGRIDEAIEAYEKSIEYIDTEMRSTAAFTHLFRIYRDKGEIVKMRQILKDGIRYTNYFNEKKANELIAIYPELRNGILDALETNSPYPEDWQEKEIEPIFRPHDVMLMIDLLEDLGNE